MQRWTGSPDLAPRQRRVLALLAVAELFDNYDASLITLALLQIQQGLAIPEEQIGQVSGAIRAGMLGSFVITVLADRLGRRRLLLLTVLGFSLFTFLSAFARSAADFVVLQALARAFIGAEVMLAAVVVVEELSARDRGWGIGVLGALGALGYGVAAIGFAAVDVLPGGWRALYVLGALPLLAVAWLRRNLPETERFERHRAERAEARQAHPWRELLRPVVGLFRSYPGRLLALSLVVFSFDFVHWTVFGFMAKSLQTLHGYAPWQVTVLILAGGSLGILGNLVAGRLGDRIGRRTVLAAGIGLHAISAAIFYGARGPIVPIAWIGIIFAATGIGVLWKALAGELFPTSHRSTAAGMRLLVATLGGASGLAFQSVLYPAALARLGDMPSAAPAAHALAITWMLPLLAVPLLGTLLLPETARRELEDIAPERYTGPG